MRGSVLLLGSAPVAAAPSATLGDLPRRDVHALFAAAEAAGRVGVGRKTRPVDARPARPGEVVVARIARRRGPGNQEQAGGRRRWVVRNRCPGTGDEECLVKTRTFAARYEGPLSAPDAEGWREFRPRGPELRFLLVSEREGGFRFTAPWGEEMPARLGDAIVRDPGRPEDTYRVAAAAFACTYEVVAPPGRE